MLVTLIIGTIGILCFVLFRYRSQKSNFWKKQGVEFQDNGDIKLLFSLLVQRVPLVEIDAEIYRKVGDVKFFGYPELFESALYIKDLDLIKQIMIKDFDYFIDRRTFDLGDSEAVLSRMLPNTSGIDWKELRSVMSPTFSTGKIKRMFDYFNICGQALTGFLNEMRQESDTLDFQDALGRFTLSVIGSTAFGQSTDVYEENSIFRKMAKKINSVTAIRIIKFLVFVISPKLAKALGLIISDSESANFFTTIIQQNIKQRRAEGEKAVKRNDFLQLLLEAQAGKLKTEEPDETGTFEKDSRLKESVVSENDRKSETVLDDVTILAQSILFFIAGSETLESALTTMAYELALNPQVQEKLAKEIHETLENNNGELSYDVVNKMTFLDMVVSESMRLHPPAFLTERQCTKDYIIPGTNIRIPQKTRIIIPIRQIHHDPKHYPEPEEFNPENFSPASKAKRHLYAYLPFGQGPRSCIAMRFAVMEAKAAIVHLVKNFKIEPCSQTPVPFKISPKSAILKPADGMPLKFNLRS